MKNRRFMLLGAVAAVLVATVGVAHWTSVEEGKVEVVLTRAVAGRVLNSAGEPVVGAHVFFTTKRLQVNGQTNVAGRFAFSGVMGTDAGRLRAWAPGYHVGEAAEQGTKSRVTLERDTGNVTLEFTVLVPGALVTGARFRLHTLAAESEESAQAEATRMFVANKGIGARTDETLQLDARRLVFYALRPGRYYIMGNQREHVLDRYLTVRKSVKVNVHYRPGRVIRFSDSRPGPWKLFSGYQGRKVGVIAWPDPVVQRHGLDGFRIVGLPWDAFALENGGQRRSFPAAQPGRDPREFDLE